MLGFARLRLTGEKAFLRELHVYGESVPIESGETTKAAIQHKGLGKKLLAEAEKIAKKHKYTELLVLSGAGVREYYRHLGYKDKDFYVVKELAD